ncbi:2'-deoxycytidine 5'-triphosphate deaminase [Dongia sedimenti]|uniref:2'-deoxycytidine 5'-triphosphate deaminase n=1 Tax=Dongia sedimenti TaxID=3064282 RepID=A0ABU0YP59_9PROT|nr:2'-deoxycytidine 5'-triphosphate deaminase [Rhodospirillaceae bacterium R-7]
MSEATNSLFVETAIAAVSRDVRTGVLPYQSLQTMIREKEIWATEEINPAQLQPASMDLRLGPVAYRVRASFLPGPDSTVLDRVKELDGYAIDLTQGAVLEKGCVYVVPLLEHLELKSGITAVTNPKSSTGRLDILTRMIADRSQVFDEVEPGYSGPLFAEITPKTFSIVARMGSRLNQIRFRRGSPALAASELQRMHDAGDLVKLDGTPKPLRGKNVAVTIDLEGGGDSALIGYRAKKHTDRIDVDKVGVYDTADFWEPIRRYGATRLILDPDEFYILATREAVRVPPDFAAEMIPYDTAVGEFRVHYAGFFDPGFGWDLSTGGSRAVLEVRSHDVPFMLEHGQTVAMLRYERMATRPDKLYGQGIGSNYQNQGLKLAKQFA